MISTIAGAAFNLVANAVLIRLYSVTGAAVATLMSEVLVFIILMKYSGKVFRVRDLYKRMPVYFLYQYLVFLLLDG